MHITMRAWAQVVGPLAIAAALLLPAGALRGQSVTSSCEAPSHDFVAPVVPYLRAAAVGTDSRAARIREAYGMSSVPADSVYVVQDEATCQSAAAAYSLYRFGAQAPVRTPVMVLRTGPNRYLVADVSFEAIMDHPHQALVSVVFDSAWTPLRTVQSGG